MLVRFNSNCECRNIRRQNGRTELSHPRCVHATDATRRLPPSRVPRTARSRARRRHSSGSRSEHQYVHAPRAAAPACLRSVPPTLCGPFPHICMLRQWKRCPRSLATDCFVNAVPHAHTLCQTACRRSGVTPCHAMLAAIVPFLSAAARPQRRCLRRTSLSHTNTQNCPLPATEIEFAHR
jgi:hypothetical protein